ncbi:HNH endonuclease [Demequina flava]|uniref:HNH endonuclease n=1 Tax=Demequina flava TaxID=1095025 RepID=UPI00078293FA|nr:HNH endonuclease signature motif containing protein [Demequina flava]
MAIDTDVLEREVARLVAFAGVEVSDLDRDQFGAMREAMGSARRALDSLSAAVASELARRSAPELGSDGLARKEGHSSPVKAVAREWGMDLGEAGRLIDVGNAIQPRPPTRPGPADLASPAGTDAPPAPSAEPAPRYRLLAQAVSDGAVPVHAAAEITRTLDAVAEYAGDKDEATSAIAVARVERQVVSRARTMSLTEVRRACRQIRAQRAPQEAERRERHQRRERYVAFTEDADGMTTISGRLDPTSAAPLRAWIDAHVRKSFQARRHLPSGADDRTPGQMRADALADLAKHGLGCEEPTMGVKATIVVRVSKEDLDRGVGVAQCDDLGGPISVSALRSLAADAEVLPAVLGGESLPLDLGRAKRHFTRAQRIALAERDAGCAWCHAPPSYCDAHHVRWWSRDGGASDLSNGVLLCTACHHRIHDTGWEVKADRSGVWMIPPASLDPERRPIVAGRAALEIDLGDAVRPGSSPPRGDNADPDDTANPLDAATDPSDTTGRGDPRARSA